MADPTVLEIDDMQNPGDSEARKIWDEYKDARQYRKQFDKDWQRYYLMYASRQWSGLQQPWQSTPIINLIFSTINTIVPILTDRKPNFSVMPRQPENEHIAGVLSSILDWLWEAQEMDVKLPMVMTNAMIFGNGFMKVLWNPTLRGGLGDIELKPVDPVHIFVSPNATSLYDAEYVIHAENLTRAEVERMYPGLLEEGSDGSFAPELNLVRNVTSQLDQGGTSGLRPAVKTSDAPGSITTTARDVGQPDSNNELVTVLERWKKVGNTLQKSVAVNDKLAEAPAEWPYTQGRHPIVQFVDTPHTWSAWAMGEVQQVEKLQIEINRRRGHIMDILNLTAHPIMAVNPAEAVGYEDWEIYPGLIIPVEGGPQSVGWINPPAIPGALFEVNRMDKEDFDIVLGNVDVLSGRRPAGIEAGIAIEMLQEAANVRMRLKVRYMEASLRRLCELCVGMIQSFYDTERIFRIAGAETQQLEKPLTADMAQFMSINQPDPATGGTLNAIPPAQTEALFDVRVGPGSTLPVSRSIHFQKALTLYSMQILDDVGVMKASGLPRWEEELVRSRQYWQAKMMMMAGIQAQQDAATESAEGGPSDDEINAEAASQDVPEPSTES